MKLYCKNCDSVKDHRQKLGGIICNTCDIRNCLVYLKRVDDDLVKVGDRANWITWKSDATYQDLVDQPEIESSLVIDISSVSWTWMTSAITQIIEDKIDEEYRFIHFKTENSEYHLHITKSDDRKMD